MHYSMKSQDFPGKEIFHCTTNLRHGQCKLMKSLNNANPIKQNKDSLGKAMILIITDVWKPDHWQKHEIHTSYQSHLGILHLFHEKRKNFHIQTCKVQIFLTWHMYRIVLFAKAIKVELGIEEKNNKAINDW